MLKVLYLPIGKQHGTEDAFKDLGCNLQILDFESIHNKSILADTFLSMVRNFQPNLCHMQLQMTGAISNEILLKAKQLSPNTIFSNWTGDVRKEPSGYFVSISNVIDFSFMSNVGQIEMYKKAGAKNVYYWQIGYDHKCYKPLNNKTFKYDIVFAGSAYGNIFPDAKLRMNIVSYLKERFGDRFGLFGTGYPNNFKASYVDIRDINAVYNSSLTNLSVSNFNDIDHYFSDRLILAMASGRPCISYRFPGQESYFKHKQDILIANNINEIGDYVDFCKKNSEEANEIGNNGYRIVKYEHSFRSRVAELLDITGVSNLL